MDRQKCLVYALVSCPILIGKTHLPAAVQIAANSSQLHLCWLQRFAMASWTSELRDAWEACTTLPGGLDNQTLDWQDIYISAQPPFLEKWTTTHLQSLLWDPAGGKIALEPSSLLPFFPALYGFPHFLRVSSGKSLSKFVAQESVSQVFSRECDLRHMGLYVLKGPCYQLREKSSLWLVRAGLKYTFLLLLVRIWNNL